MSFDRCCFCGHSDMDSSVKERIRDNVIDLIEKYDIRKFWVGNYGDFDKYSQSVVYELKKIYPDIRLELVIPYLTSHINEYKDFYYERFDNIIMADIPLNTPERYQIIKCNRYMVDNCDYMICGINHTWGGAVKTYEYAKKNNLRIINVENVKL